MAFNPVTDRLGIWRATGPNVVKAELPALDLVISTLARAGVFALSVSATAPVANQSTTAWLQPVVPSWNGEGAFFLWDKVTTSYLPANAALFLQLLEATAGENGVSWWTTVGGAPLNTVGNNGDFAIRTDEPGGVYGPKAAGAWPANPLPGTVDTITSATLDEAFGTVPGSLIVRGVTDWEVLPVGSNGDILSVASGAPAWDALSALLDALFGSLQGSVLFRSAALWDALPPGVADQILATGGPGADPAWVPRTAEFPSGTRMVFQQTDAPPGWTKDTSINDYALRVVDGAVGLTPGTAFSTVFAQVATAGHALTIPEIPSHQHSQVAPNGTTTTGGGGFPAGDAPTTINTGATGGNGAHTHPITLTVAYADVIVAEKD